MQSAILGASYNSFASLQVRQSNLLRRQSEWSFGDIIARGPQHTRRLRSNLIYSYTRIDRLHWFNWYGDGPGPAAHFRPSVGHSTYLLAHSFSPFFIYFQNNIFVILLFSFAFSSQLSLFSFLPFWGSLFILYGCPFLLLDGITSAPARPLFIFPQRPGAGGDYNRSDDGTDPTVQWKYLRNRLR